MARYKDLTRYTPVGNLLVNLETLYTKQEPQATGCIHWTGPKHRQGYGFIGAIRITDMTRIMATVHRVIMRLELNREIQQNETVVHTCSNPICCNPAHLQLGDLKLRNRIMKQNGRMPTQRRGRCVRDDKKQNRKYRYTDEEMLWIRTAAIGEIAVRFNKTRTQASRIRWAIRNAYTWLNALENK